MSEKINNNFKKCSFVQRVGTFRVKYPQSGDLTDLNVFVVAVFLNVPGWEFSPPKSFHQHGYSPPRMGWRLELKDAQVRAVEQKNIEVGG